MPIFLSLQPFGIVVLGPKGEIISSNGFPRDPEVVSRIITDGKAIERMISKLLPKLRQEDELYVNDQLLKEVMDEMGIKAILSPNEEPFLKVRRSPHKFASVVWKGIGPREYYDFLNDLGIELTKLRIRRQLSSLDQQIIKAIDYIDHVNKALNILAPAIREWYSIHFPELDDLVEDHPIFMRIVSLEPNRVKMTVEILKRAGLTDKKAKEIIKVREESMGADLSEEDLKIVKNVARNWVSLYESREKVEKFIESLMRRAAPNLSAVVHPLVGARLIATAGGLERLAKLPASSIQILGAHKAIFMHLVKGAKPPKHGILFQAKEVRGAPKKLRGKIARLLATKIAIASRIDAFGREKYVGDELRKEIDEKLKNLLRGGKK